MCNANCTKLIVFPIQNFNYVEESEISPFVSCIITKLTLNYFMMMRTLIQAQSIANATQGSIR